MHPRLKLITILILTNILLFFRDGLYLSLIVFILSLIAVSFLRLWKPYWSWLKGLIFASVLVIAIQLFTATPQPPYLCNQSATTCNLISTAAIRALWLGLLASSRIVAISTLMFLFIQTTPLRAIVQALSLLPKDITFVLTIAFGMIPALTHELKNISVAQQTRGHVKNWNLISTYFPILLPFFTRSIQRAQQLAVAMETRGEGV